MRRVLTIGLVAIFPFAMGLVSKDKIYLNPKASTRSRVDDIISRMTLEEKVALLGGTGFATKANDRLGIPALKMSDGPLGVRW